VCVRVRNTGRRRANIRATSAIITMPPPNAQPLRLLLFDRAEKKIKRTGKRRGTNGRRPAFACARTSSFVWITMASPHSESDCYKIVFAPRSKKTAGKRKSDCPRADTGSFSRHARDERVTTSESEIRARRRRPENRLTDETTTVRWENLKVGVVHIRSFPEWRSRLFDRSRRYSFDPLQKYDEWRLNNRGTGAHETFYRPPTLHWKVCRLQCALLADPRTTLRTDFPLFGAVLEVRFCRLAENVRRFCSHRFHAVESCPLKIKIKVLGNKSQGAGSGEYGGKERPAHFAWWSISLFHRSRPRTSVGTST